MSTKGSVGGKGNGEKYQHFNNHLTFHFHDEKSRVSMELLAVKDDDCRLCLPSNTQVFHVSNNSDTHFHFIYRVNIIHILFHILFWQCCLAITALACHCEILVFNPIVVSFVSVRGMDIRLFKMMIQGKI